MSGRLQRFFDRFHPRPVAGWEFLIMRLLFAGVVYLTLPGQDQIYDRQDVPNGIARFMDLTFLAEPGVYPAFRIAMIVVLGIYATGYLLPLALPFLLVTHVMVRTLFNSQGWVHHGYQMVSLVILAQTAVVLAFALHRLVTRQSFPFTGGRTRNSYLLFYSQMAIVLLYVVSVVSKVDRSDGQWFVKSHYIGLQVVKAERDRYYADLAPPEPGDVPAARLMLAHPNLTRLFLGVGVLLEFLSFLALAGRLPAFFIAIALIGFHRSIASLMSIYFHYNEMLLIIFLINAPYWIYRLALRMRKGKPSIVSLETPTA
jgi:hypothetical protein